MDAPDEQIAQLESLLSAEERERQAAFRFEHLRRDFAVAHGTLRLLLGRYTGADPAKLRFSRGAKGKPALIEAARDLQFNLSHSGRLVVFAFCYGERVGIDVERMRPMRDLEAIAKRFFRADEVADLLSLPEEDREPGFFRCWTRKEAYIKAVGDGISLGLDSFRVTFLPGQSPALTCPDNSRWNLHDLKLEEGYAAALAYPGARRPLSLE